MIAMRNWLSFVLPWVLLGASAATAEVVRIEVETRGAVAAGISAWWRARPSR